MFVGRPGWVGAWVVAGLVAATGVLGVESQRARRLADGERNFQQIVGGLGFGSERSLESCSDAFDPRLGRSCPECTRRSLLGRAVCPAHSLRLSFPR